MKRKTSNILIVVIFLAGLSLLLYPFVANKWNDYRQSQLISTYDQVVTERQGEINYEQEWADAKAYNDKLMPYILPDSFAVAEQTEAADETYMNCLNLAGDGMMGYVDIPKIDVKIPIYHTTSEEVLMIAAGHLEGSSLPVGGDDTHTVISAHRGLPSASLFTDLDKLEEGDHFLFYILDDILCYEVDQILVVEPSETEALGVEKGKDQATLLTCTPYGVNSHRLLVKGHRVPYEPEAVAQEETALTDISVHTNYFMWVVIGLVVTGSFIAFLYMKEKKLRKNLEEKESKE